MNRNRKRKRKRENKRDEFRWTIDNNWMKKKSFNERGL